MVSFDYLEPEPNLAVHLHLRQGQKVELNNLASSSMEETFHEIYSFYENLTESRMESANSSQMTADKSDGSQPKARGYSYLKALLGDSEEKNKGKASDSVRLMEQHNEFLMKRTGKDTRLAVVKNLPQAPHPDRLSKSFCLSYPHQFISLKSFADDPKKMKALADYHTQNRAPALSYVHKSPEHLKSDKWEICSIWRAAQIKAGISGFMGFSSGPKEEQDFIKGIGELTYNPKNRQSKKAYSVDCRPYANALGNILKGNGYYDKKTFHLADVHFAGIENIHIVREAFDSLLSCCETGGDMKVLTYWFCLLKSIMEGAMLVRDYILAGDSVIVNCSDGWDRTPQLCSLAKLLIEPYYRTLKGFEMLIQTEWVAFGHMFKTRQSFLNNGEHSPVFFQFLDCVFQLLRQFPSSFEFNEKLLIVLGLAYLQGVFEEFVFDSTEQYLDYLHQEHLMPSFWACVRGNRASFENKDYETTSGAFIDVDSNPAVFEFFGNLYFNIKFR